jgi:hypothetical protein
VPPYELRWEDELGNTLGTGVAPCATLLADFDPHAQTGARTVTLIVTDALGRESQQHMRVFVHGEVSYCTAKVNSCGSTPEIGSLGLPSASSSSGFVVTASHARGGKVGFVLYSDAGRFAAPFQGGTLCLRAPIRRTPSFDSSGSPGACEGTFAFDMNAFAAGLLGGNPRAFLQVPGMRVNCQVWGRDTQQHGSYLSDGLEYVIRE